MIKKLDVIALILLIIGGINWGLYGILNFNIVDYLFGRIWVDKVIYFLVGVSAIYTLVVWKRFCICKKRQG